MAGPLPPMPSLYKQRKPVWKAIETGRGQGEQACSEAHGEKMPGQPEAESKSKSFLGLGKGYCHCLRFPARGHRRPVVWKQE